jgi:hypothetical protein
MIQKDTVVIQSRTKTTDAEGVVGYTFATLKTIVADVQPANLTESQLKQWSLTDLAANAKKMFYAKDSQIIIGLRAVTGGETYEIRGTNQWPRHDEAIMIPVQGL